MTVRGGHLFAVVALASALAGACRDTSLAYRRLLPDADRAPPELQAACRRAAEKCTQCHPIDRVVTIERLGPGQWERVVARMRLKPSSGISASDGAMILNCLVHREAGVAR
jgi:hypothetical protein